MLLQVHFEQALEDTVGSDIYICGMQPLVEGCPCHGIFQCDPDLSCRKRCAPIEADIYASKRSLMVVEGFVKDINLCAISAGKSNDAEGAKINPDFKTAYASVKYKYK
jgi:hypothetical protein